MRNIFKSLIFIGLFVLISGESVLHAVPAYPHPVTLTLPDGSKLTVKLFGDEFAHYTTTSDGYEILKGADGFYYYAHIVGNTAIATSVRAKDPADRKAEDIEAISGITRTGESNGARLTALRRSNRMLAIGMQKSLEAERARTLQNEKAPAAEKFKSLVILVDFQDVKFTVPEARNAFSRLLNEDGYTVNGANGSAWNYYYDNSNGRFDGQFDVVGPYTVSRDMAYYGQNGGNGEDLHPEEMVREACELAAAHVNFGDYIQGGYVKDIFVFYAGYAESYTGADPNTIWPHRWPVGLYGLQIQGYRFMGYACASELTWLPPSTQMAPIGTFCHEFGHVLGWPDFYDTDYADNGTSITPDVYSLMASGSYNDNGNTPPALTAMERYMMGWLEPEPITTSGNYELDGVWNDKAYILRTPNSEEYYLFETRSSTANKWDAGLGIGRNGMLVTHIDRSGNIVPGAGRSALSLWASNELNCFAAHPCARPVRASNSLSSYWLFPQGSVNYISGYSHSAFVPWSGNKSEYAVRNISYSAGKVTFSVDVDSRIIIESVYQNDAQLSWKNFDHSGMFKVELYRGGTLVRDWTQTAKTAYISSLTPKTVYTLKVTSQEDGSDVSSEYLDFITLDMTAPYPSIFVNDLYLSTHDVILRIMNVEGTVASVTWTIDGVSAEPPSVRLAAGQHKIVATITMMDGRVEKIFKTIIVQ